MSAEYTQVLLVVRECHVYRVPPRTSAAGHRAGDWGDPEQSLWKGRLRILELADGCEIRLEDALTGELFAACPYDVSGKSVEAVLDSSRYFVLRVESDAPDDGSRRHAYIGIGFLERSEGFDFNAALQDWTRRQKSIQSLAENAKEGPSPHVPAGPKQDFSLGEGQTVSIQLPTTRGKRVSAGAGTAPRAGFVLPPPPPPAAKHAHE
ncbi:hypothetical protein MSPP1_001968 [Malassezia sp. CBS 17886]|nr:hypothetical protein MSPP1_001968 [Malassezia sp. CBS 17886]